MHDAHKRRRAITLCLTLGLFGAHRFYLGRSLSACCMLSATLFGASLIIIGMEMSMPQVMFDCTLTVAQGECDYKPIDRNHIVESLGWLILLLNVFWVIADLLLYPLKRSANKLKHMM